MAKRIKKLPVIDPEDWLREIADYLADPDNKKMKGEVQLVTLAGVTVDAIVDKLRIVYQKYEETK